jgi:hypothetical protein
VSRTNEQRTQVNNRIRGQASVNAGHPVSLRQALRARDPSPTNARLPDTVDPREYVVRGIATYQTRDRVLDFAPEEVRFVGDVQGEINYVRVSKGWVDVSLQIPDEFINTLTDAVRLSRGHPLFIRLYELFPRPESAYADGSHPDDVPWGPEHPNHPDFQPNRPDHPDLQED